MIEGLPTMRNICVFTGSSAGRDSRYHDAAVRLGTVLGERGIGLVYGGAMVGLMGAVADATLAAGGHVTGVIPKALVDREVAHTGLSDLRVVGSMHERKALMADLSDAFIALPGGIGTFEELFEAWTWHKLGTHSKPCAILNTAGFYDQLVGFLDHVVTEEFLTPSDRAMLLAASDPDTLLDRLAAYSKPAPAPLIGRDER